MHIVTKLPPNDILFGFHKTIVIDSIFIVKNHGLKRIIKNAKVNFLSSKQISRDKLPILRTIQIVSIYI